MRAPLWGTLTDNMRRLDTNNMRRLDTNNIRCEIRRTSCTMPSSPSCTNRISAKTLCLRVATYDFRTASRQRGRPQELVGLVALFISRLSGPSQRHGTHCEAKAAHFGCKLLRSCNHLLRRELRRCVPRCRAHRCPPREVNCGRIFEQRFRAVARQHIRRGEYSNRRGYQAPWLAWHLAWQPSAAAWCRCARVCTGRGGSAELVLVALCHRGRARRALGSTTQRIAA